MNDQVAAIKLLSDQLAQARAKNPSYSARAFARKLGLSSAALSEILGGKRPLSRKIAVRIADRLGLEPRLRSSFLAGVPLRRAARPGILPTREAVMVEQDQFKLISEWYHFAILSLMETDAFVADPAWIGARLGIRSDVARAALSRLERLGLVARDPAGKLSPAQAEITTTDHIKDGSIRKSHLQDLDLVRKSMETDRFDLHDFTSMTMTLDPARMSEAKQWIRAFRDDFCREFEKGQRKEVYKLCLNFIPLSKDPS